MTTYRYPQETFTLLITIAVVSIALVIAAGASFCLLPIILLVIVILSYWMSYNHHQELRQAGKLITPTSQPDLAALIKECEQKIEPGTIETILIGNRELNAYTFGLSSPKVIVLHSALFSAMDSDEIRFIVGHEMGHVALGHTWLNSLLGGMAGVPSSLGAVVVLTFAFRWWNRACEYSADRAGLLACGSLAKARSALIKLASNARTPEQLERALKVIDAEDEDWSNVLAESLSTHPMIIHRIEELQQYATGAEYRQMQARVNRKVSGG